MTREELIKAMARAVDENMPFEPVLVTSFEYAKFVAAEILTALESALPGLSDVVEGRDIIIPREMLSIDELGPMLSAVERLRGGGHEDPPNVRVDKNFHCAAQLAALFSLLHAAGCTSARNRERRDTDTSAESVCSYPLLPNQPVRASSNGRTPAFGAVNLGSNPRARANSLPTHSPSCGCVPRNAVFTEVEDQMLEPLMRTARAMLSAAPTKEAPLMTSGNFQSFPLSSIWVNREKRQRRELKGIDELAASIARVGLINPIVIQRSGELRAGERRFTAITQLGWTHVPVQFIEDLSEDELHRVELEENVRRSDLTWQDQCAAVHAYHQLRLRDDKGWSSAATARELGYSQSHANDMISIYEEILRGNQRVIEAPKLSTATTVTMRSIQRRRNDQIEVLDREMEMPAVAEKKAAPLINADFLKWAATYKGPKFNFIHCDFPYGVGAQAIDQGGTRFEFGSYDDRPEIYWELLNGFIAAQERFVSTSAHLMFWFSMDYYTETKAILEAGGWVVNPFPLVWHKTDNSGIIPDPKRGPRRVYETAFMAARGDRFVASIKSNAVGAANTKSIHMSEKPLPVLAHFFQMFVDDSTFMLDPTCGSANAVKQAERLGAKKVLGIEMDPEFYGRAKEAYYDDDSI